MARRASRSRSRSRSRARALHPSERLGALTALVLVVTGAWSCGAGTGQPAAVAEVVHGVGFEATVLGWTSWYGTYGLGDLGIGWCIDHGLLAPDASLGYVPTTVTDASDDTKAAVGWAVTRNPAIDAVTAAAVMLVVHDLMGAQYPFGRIDVDTMGLVAVGGFGGHEGDLLAAARRIKADALAHARLRAPFRIDVVAAPVDPGARGHLQATVVDASGRGVDGIAVTLGGSGATIDATGATTDDAGRVRVAFTAGPGRSAFTASALVPDPTLHAFAPTRAKAQRIAQPHVLRADGAAGFSPAPATTTTTAPPGTTSTTRPTVESSPPTTTTPPTSSPPPTTIGTTTTLPPTTSTPPSTTGTTTTTATTVPPSLPTSPAPPARSSPPTTTAGSLPVTGATTRGIALVALGLVLLGGSLVGFGRRRAAPVPSAGRVR